MVVVVIGVNLVSIFFSQSSALRVMHAFHLTSDHYAWWVLEQVSPRMYTFSNKAKKTVEEKAKRDRQVNHYPTRVMTFVHRPEELQGSPVYRISSAYRGVYLETYFLAETGEGNQVELVQVKQSKSDEK